MNLLFATSLKALGFSLMYTSPQLQPIKTFWYHLETILFATSLKVFGFTLDVHITSIATY